MLNGVLSLPLPGEVLRIDKAIPAGVSRGEPLHEFIAGPENELAVTAVLAALSDSMTAYNPLLLHGPSGTGKSHLAGGLACEFRRRDPQANIVHLFAADYARELSDAIETQAVREWDRRHRNADLLILEDLDFLSANASAQGHLARTLDVVLRRGGLVVVTSSGSPYDSPHLSAPLRSRLSGGLTVGLALPGLAARTEIIRRLAAERRMAATDEGARALAAGLATGVRDLMGALCSLAAQPEGAAGVSSQLNLERVVALLAARRTERAPGVAAIAARTAKYFSLRVAELRGPTRRRHVALARSVAIYLSREMTDQSLEKVGKYFGGRDHTTVLHAARRIVELLECDADTRRAVEQLREDLSL